MYKCLPYLVLDQRIWNRLAQTHQVNFKCMKFKSARAFSYSLRKEKLKNGKISEIGPRLDMPLSIQNYTI